MLFYYFKGVVPSVDAEYADGATDQRQTTDEKQFARKWLEWVGESERKSVKEMLRI